MAKRKKKTKIKHTAGRHEMHIDHMNQELDDAMELLDEGQFIKGAAKGFTAIGRSVKEISSDPVGFATEWFRS